jgi:hypothetical protein
LQSPAQSQYYSAISKGEDGGTGTYDALYLAVQKRLSSGISILTNYTWSHCISDVFDQQTSATATISSIPGDRRRYRGNCTGSDLRHLFILNMVAATPRFSHKYLRLVASDWQVAPILQVKSAQLFSVVSGTDRALTTASGQTANYVAAVSPYTSSPNCPLAPCIQWTNRSAFTVPDSGTYGNLGLNNLKGPGVLQLNLALSRTFRIAESKALQLRGEAFNLPNHLNPSTPVNSLSSPNFGQITTDISGTNGLTSGGDPRIIQLAAKFYF